MPARDRLTILGGGLCGCLLAKAWADSGGHAEIIEAGPSTPPNRRPAEWLGTLAGPNDWGYQTVPQKHLAERRLNWPRGRGLGGSTRINAMIWMPPSAEDIAMLARVGLDPDHLARDADRARDWVQPEQPRYLSQPTKQFLDAKPLPGAVAFGRTNHNGRRWTSADCLESWDATTGKKRISVLRHRITRLRLSDRRVMALETSTNDLIKVDRLAIALGAVDTPRLLQRSGFDSVGDNLHDHLIMPVVYGLNENAFRGSAWSVSEIAQWQHGGVGPIASNVAECGGFDQNRTLQFHVTPTHYLRYPNRITPAMTLGVNLCTPRSRGSIRTSSEGTLQIDPGYQTDADDRDKLRTGVRRARELIAFSDLRDYVTDELIPGPRKQDDHALEASIARYAQTLYHPGGTCAIGRHVDACFGLVGVDNCFVVDASILPQPTMANPSATLAMLAIHAASQIALSC
ncbi:MAG: GMC family oxidoreductase [Planctomycetota bacterium]